VNKTDSSPEISLALVLFLFLGSRMYNVIWMDMDSGIQVM